MQNNCLDCPLSLNKNDNLYACIGNHLYRYNMVHTITLQSIIIFGVSICTEDFQRQLYHVVGHYYITIIVICCRIVIYYTIFLCLLNSLQILIY
jgi:hypothetical protein